MDWTWPAFRLRAIAGNHDDATVTLLVSGSNGRLFTLYSGEPCITMCQAPWRAQSTMKTRGKRRQVEIYSKGAARAERIVPVNAARLEAVGLRRMSAKARGYIAGGAGSERTIAANRAAFDNVRIIPRILAGNDERNLGVEIFGRRHELPFLLGPIGVLDLAHRNGDIIAARAASAEGICFVASCQSSVTLEEIARQGGAGRRWFQLYCSSEIEISYSLARRAEAAGYEALVVTVDTTELGWRPRDLERSYLPFARGRGIANYVSDPVFRSITAPTQKTPMRSLASLIGAAELLTHWPQGPYAALASWGRTVAEIQKFVSKFSHPMLSWDNLAAIKTCTSLPVVVKGVLHPDDARRAMEIGCDGLIVSNHGGRQVDGAIAALDALPAIVSAVGGRIPVLFDSGIRTGSDVMKALCLGARAVLVARPYVYAIAIAGENGTRALIRNLAAELDLTMGLCGQSDVAKLGPWLLSNTATGDARATISPRT